MRLADESRVSALKDQLNLPKSHASKPTNLKQVNSGSDSSGKQSENVLPMAVKSLPGEAGEAAPGIPVFTFSKTSFSAL